MVILALRVGKGKKKEVRNQKAEIMVGQASLYR